MMFVTANALAYASSRLKCGLLGRVFGKRKEEQRAVRKIRRNTHTDHRLVFDKKSRNWLLCFGAVIELTQDDVDFDFFEECGRTGITTVTIYGNGALAFDEEDMQLDDDDFVFTEHPGLHFPYRPRESICPRSSSAVHATAIVLEMV